jgi:hypothetical protein
MLKRRTKILGGLFVVTGFWVALVLANITPPIAGHIDAKKNSSVLKCKAIANAIESYYLHPHSGKTFPENLQQLLDPPFGGPTFLKRGQDDLIDSWGKPFQWTSMQNKNGDRIVLVYTIADDGTKISNFGQGRYSRF